MAGDGGLSVRRIGFRCWPALTLTTALSSLVALGYDLRSSKKPYSSLAQDERMSWYVTFTLRSTNSFGSPLATNSLTPYVTNKMRRLQAILRSSCEMGKHLNAA